MLPRSGSIRIPQHPRQLSNAVFAVDHFHVAGRDSLPGLLGHDEVAGGAGRNLGEVSDHEDLAALGDLGQGTPYLRTHLSTDSLIQLVEDESRNGVVPSKDDLECQHEAGQFATRCRARERTPLHALVEPHHEDDGFLPLRLNR